MKRYVCTVIRKQSWTIEVDADSAEEAKKKADEEASKESAHDDWAYETTAVEQRK